MNQSDRLTFLVAKALGSLEDWPSTTNLMKTAALLGAVADLANEWAEHLKKIIVVKVLAGSDVDEDLLEKQLAELRAEYEEDR